MSATAVVTLDVGPRARPGEAVGVYTVPTRRAPVVNSLSTFGSAPRWTVGKAVSAPGV